MIPQKHYKKQSFLHGVESRNKKWSFKSQPPGMPPANCNCPLSQCQTWRICFAHPHMALLFSYRPLPHHLFLFGVFLRLCKYTHSTTTQIIGFFLEGTVKLKATASLWTPRLKTKLWRWELDVSTGFPGSNLPSTVGSTEMWKCEKSLKTGIVCRAGFDKAAP